MKNEKVIYRVPYVALRKLLGLPDDAQVVQLFHEGRVKDTLMVKVYGHGSMVEEGDLIPTIDWKPERNDVGLVVDTEEALRRGAMKPKRIPAEVFPASVFLREELEARGWSLETTALVTGLTIQTLEELLSGHRRFTHLTATCIGKALGTGPEVWLNLQKAELEARQ